MTTTGALKILMRNAFFKRWHSPRHHLPRQFPLSALIGKTLMKLAKMRSRRQLPFPTFRGGAFGTVQLYNTAFLVLERSVLFT